MQISTILPNGTKCSPDYPSDHQQLAVNYRPFYLTESGVAMRCFLEDGSDDPDLLVHHIISQALYSGDFNYASLLVALNRPDTVIHINYNGTLEISQ